MKRPFTSVPKRPRNARSLAARTRKEAAIHLVRIEFDIARLELGMSQALQRAEAARGDLVDRIRQRRRLLAILER
ncbi:hypothetical protein [Roseivivax halodurans]|uniref:hypothetical protein n=1 Tax=Roseivivax halodurans TaxID=93683 RepID=UPI0004BA582B|nr:hypothetical protein [Roseivivax halodurans]